MSSVSKRGAGIQFVLPPEATATEVDEHSASSAPDSEPVLQPRGGVASIAMAVTLGRDVRQQFEAQKARLAEYDKSGSPPITIDPRRVTGSRYANRHEASFSTPEFADFKADIRESGGNLVPIKVRPIKDAKPGEPDFEVNYGHRRLRACLEDGLRVTVLVQPVDDRKLFVDMDRENRGRASLSAWEQGIMYARALGDRLFANQKVLAGELGLSEAVVSRAIAIGNLPSEIVGCFSSPLAISYRTGLELAEAVAADTDAVLRRAAEIFATTPRLDDVAVVRLLVDAGKKRAAVGKGTTTPLLFGKRKLGKVTVAANGTMSIELKLPAIDGGKQERFMQALRAAIDVIVER